jgi:hypothetical protein
VSQSLANVSSPLLKCHHLTIVLVRYTIQPMKMTKMMLRMRILNLIQRAKRRNAYTKHRGNRQSSRRLPLASMPLMKIWLHFFVDLGFHTTFKIHPRYSLVKWIMEARPPVRRGKRRGKETKGRRFSPQRNFMLRKIILQSPARQAENY